MKMNKDSSDSDSETDLEHKCNVCLLTFRDKSKLIKHRASHTGLKAHVFEICDKKLGQLDCYKKHVIVHTGLNPYKCDVCYKGFSDKGYLEKHKFIHKCVICLQ